MHSQEKTWTSEQIQEMSEQIQKQANYEEIQAMNRSKSKQIKFQQ